MLLLKSCHFKTYFWKSLWCSLLCLILYTWQLSFLAWLAKLRHSDLFHKVALKSAVCVASLLWPPALGAFASFDCLHHHCIKYILRWLHPTLLSTVAAIAYAAYLKDPHALAPFECVLVYPLLSLAVGKMHFWPGVDAVSPAAVCFCNPTLFWPLFADVAAFVNLSKVVIFLPF